MAAIFHSDNIQSALDNVEFDWDEPFIEEDSLWDDQNLADIDFDVDDLLNDYPDY